MFDIFEEKEAPKLYIADIIVSVKIPSRGKKISYSQVQVRLKNNPIVLLNGKFPTKKTELDFFKKVYNHHIKRSDFEKIIFKIESIENIRFSSNLMYDFNYYVH